MRHAIILATVAVTAPLGAAGLDQTYAVGGTGWALERFGDDVAILRATIADVANGVPGSLILSCERGTRRLTLILPKTARMTDGALASAGALLIRPLGPNVAAIPAVLARTTGLRSDALIVSEDAASMDRPVLALGRLLVARPAGIDFLLHTGTGHITLSGLTALRLAVSSRVVDELAFRDFATTCEYRSPRP